MLNPYSIILALFIAAGFFATVWGLRIILNARKSLQWPQAEGTIIESSVAKHDDMLPNIVFSYKVNEQSYRKTLAFPGDITPTAEFLNMYLDKYPVNRKVQVYYDSLNPDNATLEPGLGKGDWLVFALGFGMFVLGIFLMIL